MAKSRLAAASCCFPVADAKLVALATSLEPAALAWEFLRRNPAYVEDYRHLRAGRLAALPKHWGLLHPIDPEARDLDFRTIWRRSVGTVTTPPAVESLAGFPQASARR